MSQLYVPPVVPVHQNADIEPEARSADRLSYDADVIVVGAGAAGLAARAAAESRGFSTVLFEAQDRLGGRVWTKRDEHGVPFDLGAQFLNGDMSYALQLARQAEAWLMPVPATGRAIVEHDGLRIDWDDSASFGPGKVGFDPAAILSRRKDISAHELIGRLVEDRQEEMLTLAVVEELFGKSAVELSAKGIADVASKWASDRRDTEFHVRDGMIALIDALAERAKGPILLEKPVEAIEIDSNTAIVRSSQTSATGRAIVIAVPPTVAGRISMPLEIAEEVAPYLKSYVAGDMIKATLGYSMPFWRRSGYAGGSLRLGDPQLTTLDSSRDDGSMPRLTVFVGGRSASVLATMKRESRRASILATLVSVFGDEAAQPETFADSVWVDHPWSGGGYNAAIRVGGQPDAGDRLMAMGGRLAFAGAEYAPAFRGFVEGALRSGERAVDQLAPVGL